MKKILIIDDAPDARHLLKTMLRPYEVEILEAEDGVKGWQSIIKDQPDIVLLDLHMPHKDGFDILKDLEEEWMGVPVVVVSGDKEQETIDSCMLYGAKAYLQKPVALNELKDVIKVLQLSNA
jgi:DNA-binding response OmpR family regulator